MMNLEKREKEIGRILKDFDGTYLKTLEISPNSTKKRKISSTITLLSFHGYPRASTHDLGFNRLLGVFPLEFFAPARPTWARSIAASANLRRTAEESIRSKPKTFVFQKRVSTESAWVMRAGRFSGGAEVVA